MLNQVFTARLQFRRKCLAPGGRFHFALAEEAVKQIQVDSATLPDCTLDWVRPGEVLRGRGLPEYVDLAGQCDRTLGQLIGGTRLRRAQGLPLDR